MAALSREMIVGVRPRPADVDPLRTNDPLRRAVQIGLAIWLLPAFLAVLLVGGVSLVISAVANAFARDGTGTVK